MTNIEVRAIEKGTLNGFAVKFFEIWIRTNNKWHFDSHNHAPVKVANKNLYSYAREHEKRYEPMLDRF